MLETKPIIDYQPRCRCGRILGDYFARPWRKDCGKCHETNGFLPGDTMYDLVRLKNAVPADFVTELRERAETILSQIHQDYFPQKSFETFKVDHLGHESLVMKLVAYRFFTMDIANRLRELVGPGMLIHPVFYLRFSYPDTNYSTAFLDSQPHYDTSYNLNAQTFWLALCDIDTESGGLCSFNSEEIHDHFPAGETNRYNLDRYWDAAPEIDPMLREGTVSPAIQAGDILTFDSSMLHGATKPISRKRISLDFRLMPKQLLVGKDSTVKNIFYAVNEDLDDCNKRNIAAYSRQDILQPGAKASWRREYAWLMEPDLRTCGE